MPPQVRADGTRPAVQQPPLPEVHNDESKDVAKSTSSADTSAAKTQTAETKSGTSAQQKKEPEDPKAAARQAQGSKQIAIAKQKEHNDQAQIVQKDLHKRVPQSKTESIYESAKQVAEFVAVKAPIAAVVVAEQASTVGAEQVRQQKVEQLGRRTHPQDMVKGQLFEVEDINPSNSNKISTDKKTEPISTSPGTIVHSGKVIEFVDHPKQTREATQSGVEERLKELNGGAPLTDFEKKLVSDWSKRGGEDKTLTPIKGIDSKDKMDKEVQAYKISTGGSGQRHTNYYDRNGNVLREAGTSERPLVNEGLGPIEYLGYGLLVKKVATSVGKKVGERLAAQEAAAITKAETGTVVRSAEKRVASETEKAGVTTHNTSWRQGSGTSVHVKPSGAAPKPPASEFTKAEEKVINDLQDSGMLRKEAEDVIRSTRGGENAVEVVNQGPNAVGKTRSSR